MRLENALGTMTGTDREAARLAREQWNRLAKPLGSLGALEDAVVRIAGLTGSARVSLSQRSLLVFCADNGVLAQGVTQSGPEVTAAVAAALAGGTSTVNYMAEKADCRVLPVNIGMLRAAGAAGNASSPEKFPLLDRCVRRGTADITRGPAMTRGECIRAIETGIELAKERRDAGDRLLLLGEMGIGNTTTACAAACALLGEPAEKLAGRGSGLSDEGLRRKIGAIRRALEVNRPDPRDPVDVLQKVGGLDLAALCGVVLGGALYRIPVLMDGMITNAAALCAVRMCPRAEKALLASHLSPEPAARRLLAELTPEPLICAGLRLGEGSGAVAALPLLDMALAVYHSGHTFGKLGIEPYVPQ